MATLGNRGGTTPLVATCLEAIGLNLIEHPSLPYPAPDLTLELEALTNHG
jgi:hypothetical protein